MYIGLDRAAKDKASFLLPFVYRQKRLYISLVDVTILLGLALVAMLPRFIVALQLDMVSDESTYIEGGKIYFSLFEHLNIGARGWRFNYEHPALAKLFIGLSLSLNALLRHPFDELVATRIPSIMMGTLLVLAIYWLGYAPLGRVVALLAALCLAFSPWLVYFSALAYLDMTMTAFITLAYLLLWYAPQRPVCYPLSAALVGLGAACKYTAVLVIPGMVLFTAYYFCFIRPRLSVAQRLSIPWRWWVSCILLAPLSFLAADPAIWPSPYHLLVSSFYFEWEHSLKGHLAFFAGQTVLHAPYWTILFILFAKMSVFVTFSAALFVCYALIQFVRFHRHVSTIYLSEVTSLAFLLIWLMTIIGMFSMLTIVVGTHYELPAAPPVALAAAYGLARLLRYQRGGLLLLPTSQVTTPHEALQVYSELPSHPKATLNPALAMMVVLLTIVLVGSHVFALVTIPDVEGYSSEFFYGENTVLQVAYPGYRDALQWLTEHTHGSARVGLAALPTTLTAGGQHSSWYAYNRDLMVRYHLTEAHPDDHTYPYDYLIWPMHLVQRGFPLPAPWKSHVLHVVSGGNTIYCYITVRTASSLTIKGSIR